MEFPGGTGSLMTETIIQDAKNNGTAFAKMESVAKMFEHQLDNVIHVER
jgi:hypothetical protein